MDEIYYKIFLIFGSALALYFLVELTVSLLFEKTSAAITKRIQKNGIIKEMKNRSLKGNLFYYYCWLIWILWIGLMSYVIPKQLSNEWSVDSMGGIILGIFISFKLLNYLLYFRRLRNATHEPSSYNEPQTNTLPPQD